MRVRVSKAAARRFLLYAQGLLEVPGVIQPWAKELRGRSGLLRALERLEAVQLDPIAVVERNHHLVLRNRVGGYRPEHLDGLFAAGQVFEYLANARCVLPMRDLPDFWPIMLAARQLPARAALADVMTDVLRRLYREGPLPPRALGNDGPRLLGLGYNPPDKASKASGRAIDLLWLGGEVFVARREGNEKWYDLAERVIPRNVAADLPGDFSNLRSPMLRAHAGVGAEGQETGPERAGDSAHGAGARGEGGGGEGERRALPGDSPVLTGVDVSRPWSTPDVGAGEAEWQRFLLDKYMRAYRLVDLGDFRFGWQSYPSARRRALAAEKVAKGEWVEVEVDGVRRRYFALAEDRPCLEVAGDWEPRRTVRFLAPLDNLLWRRERLQDLFDFDYTWEVYTPAAKRRFGYYAMPILYGDRLIGRLDPKLDRENGVLVVNRLQLELDGVDRRGLETSLEKALYAFARWHGAEDVRILQRG
ncbi:winged helix-turn-helix domain-containing protein [Symbiobacterium thermophilum]|uniref:Conserved domain protein n=1 Tax=Symbiobacterium thermophilum (strain DSM 24528 / JCM 14929 / IAM 14863 / T) TaxID=292459 RepID=Q67LZ2_SYMTH|nr:crosslink repair DNA glycosylase YcaQ family protein [Symbiobacterium thermophilum]BAD41304.1 conserved domain protein [Symbiobacterium thermophilum IAM 14863]